MKTLIAALLLVLSTNALAASKPQVNKICATAAQKFFLTMLGSSQLQDANASDANEKSIQLVKSADHGNAQTFKVIYSAVNREVGFNMEGEWQATAVIETQMAEGDPLCFVTASTIKIGMPKQIILN